MHITFQLLNVVILILVVIIITQRQLLIPILVSSKGWKYFFGCKNILHMTNPAKSNKVFSNLWKKSTWRISQTVGLIKIKHGTFLSM
jgi:hypothetical protein